MNYDKYSETFLHFHTTDIPEILRKYISGNLGLLDLGAGDGNLLVSLDSSGKLKNFKKITAVDLSPIRCERLKKYTNFEVICADATHIPRLQNNSYDFIICTQVIEHVDEMALLDEIKRLLSPNGILYIASITKSKYGWWYYKDKMGNWALDPTHLREYKSEKHFEKVISEAGFEVLETVSTKLKLSIIEFIIRRVIVPIFRPENIHSLFMKYPFADYIRRNLNLTPPGYKIVETIAKKY